MKSKYIITFCLAISTLISCTDKAINLDQIDSISYAAAFSTSGRCELSTLGCYSYAQGTYRGFPFGSRAIEYNDVKGEDVMTSGYFNTVYGATFTAQASDVSSQWSYLFKLVNQTNIVIDGVETAAEKGILTQNQAEEYEAEARFLRALAWHDAVVFYAQPYNHTANASHYGIPVVTSPCNTIAAVNEATKKGRSSVKETYDAIIADLDYAEIYLPSTRTGSLQISRATKGAAIALKTRIYQHMGKWDKVVEECAKLVPTSSTFVSSIGGYQLTASVDGPFKSNSSNTESIFSIENSSSDNPTLDGCLGQMYYGRKELAISPIIYNSKYWEATDLRRTSLLDLVDNKYFTKKYPNYINMDDWAPIIRYAEVLLTAAEAEARVNGKTQRALNLLNAVRNRAVTESDKQYTLTSFANASEMINAILNEKRIEFIAEGKRWYDIHRLSTDPEFAVTVSTGEAGIPQKVTFASVILSDYSIGSGVVRASILTVDEIPASDRRFIYPIPQDEINANPLMEEQQNEGW